MSKGTHSGNRAVKKFEYLHPRTATKPILLREYLVNERRTLVMDGDRVSSEWREWYWKQIAKGNDTEKGDE